MLDGHVNFVGHLAVARHFRRDPAFWLGAMLPDFTGMIGAPVAKAVHSPSALADGVALHHRTDDAFHGADAFVALTRAVFEALLERGIARGPARAVAHVGVELLLDGELGTDPTLVHDYELAVQVAPGHWSGWFDDAALGARTAAFVARLSAYGFPWEYADPAAVSRRIVRILADRPRLALPAEAHAATEAVLAWAQPAVQQGARGLLADVIRVLAVRHDGHNEG